jgi:hypothetical protein
VSFSFKSRLWRTLNSFLGLDVEGWEGSVEGWDVTDGQTGNGVLIGSSIVPIPESLGFLEGKVVEEERVLAEGLNAGL